MFQIRFSRCFLIIACLLLFNLPRLYAQQFSSDIEYQADPLVHNQPEDGQVFHLLGWLLSNNTFTHRKHSLHVNLSLTHGGEPSANIIGDLQTFSNLEAGTLLGVYEAYYHFGNEDVWFKFGQTDINLDFALSRVGMFFTHSSFGIDPVLSVNTPAPTYPVAGLSASTRLKLSENLYLRAAIFDGQFAQPSDNRLRLDWRLKEGEGLIYILEPEFKLFRGKLNQKMGYYRHTGTFTDQETAAPAEGLTSLYLIGDIDSLEWNGKSLSLFYQINKSIGKASIINHYYGAGLTLNSPFGDHKSHTLGFAVAHVSLNSQYALVSADYNFGSETAIELSYEIALKEWLSIQPYVHHLRFHNSPERENSFIFALRVKAAFDILK